MDLRFLVTKHFDVFRKITDMVQKFSPFPTEPRMEFEIDHIPIEISRILQKMSYQVTIDNSRLLNRLKDDVVKLAKSAKFVLEKYTLRDRGVCLFVQEFDQIVEKLKDNEYYDT